MLTQETLDRTRRFTGGSFPVLSVYLNLGPDPREGRSVGARLRDALKPMRDAAGRLDHRGAESLRRDVESVLGLQDRIEKDLGHGVAIFACSGKDFLEYMSLPRRVWDLAVADARPYIRPMAAVLDEFHRYAAVVVDRRRAQIFESYMGEFELWHESVEEGERKSNFGGWYGLEEYGVRHRAEEIAHRHYRETAKLIGRLFAERGLEVLFVGGHKGSVEEFLPFLPTRLAKDLGGTFVLDPHTATPAIVHERCAKLEDDYERAMERGIVEELLIGTRPVAIGLERTIAAANVGAIDLLLVDDGAVASGTRCDACGQLGLDAGPCPRCGATLRPCGDIVEELVRTTIEDGGSTEHVFARTPLRGKRVSAFLRFS